MKLLYYIIGILILTACIPTRQKCLELYPQQYRDTIITTHDTIATPFLIQLPGDTIRIEGKIDKPCPDSLIQWAKFNAQLNAYLNKDKRLIQYLQLTKDSLKYTAKTKGDTVRLLNKTILIQNERIKTYQQAIIAYQNKVPSWCWWLLGFVGLLLGAGIVGIILKFSK